MSPPLRIAHLTEGIDERRGGPARSVPGLARAQRRAGHAVAVFAVRHHGDPPQAPWTDFGVWLSGPSRVPLPAFTRDLLPQVLGWRPDIIHSHGIWTYVSWAAARAARKLSVPHVCAPRGMLDPWALRQKSVKKRLGSMLYQRRILASATCLHALTGAEAEAIRALGSRAPIAIVPNGIELDPRHSGRSRDRLEQRYPFLRDRRIVLFLGRLHPKKGVLELLHAWRLLGEKGAGWHLVVAGPDEGGFEQAVRAQIDRLCIAQSVSLLPAQRGDEVWEWYLGADVFALPSHSEGFSMAVLEALACGLPVCITDACHFDEIEAAGCGIVCRPTPDSIAAALARLIDAGPAERQAMGRRGRELIKSRYSWDRVAAGTVRVYRWLRDPSRPTPESVV